MLFRNYCLVIFVLSFCWKSSAQDYRLLSSADDPFSKAMIALLNAAPERFSGLAGDTLRHTWLGTDLDLLITVPGAELGIVRNRDWDVNVYLEFRGYRTAKDRDRGMREFVTKLHKALGDQLLDPFTRNESDEVPLSLSLANNEGYYRSNMELLPGSTNEPVYLLAPEDGRALSPGKNFFFLFKIYAGKPAFYYYNKLQEDAETVFGNTLKQVMEAAREDFDQWKSRQSFAVKKRDTILLNGIPVYLHFRGSNYSASLEIPLADTAAGKEIWSWYHRAIQSATGTQCVHTLPRIGNSQEIFYFCPGQNSPRIRMTLTHVAGQHSRITIRIESIQVHPVKRALDPRDH